MRTADARAILLARPGEARTRLCAALEQAGIEVVLQADPLEAGPDEVAATGARNVVIVVDTEVEDALDRFDALLSDPHYRILFEEAGLVIAREGWDMARWSRHIGAKLLGHGDVLPSGHEEDGDAPACVAGAAVETTTAADVAGNDAADGAPVAEEASSAFAPEAPEAPEAPGEAASTLETEAMPADRGEMPSAAPRDEAAVAFAPDEVAPAPDAVDPDDVAFGVAHDVETADIHAARDELLAAEDAAPGEPAVELPEPPTDAALDWTRFQDFDAVNELPAANTPQAAEADYRAALAPLEEIDLSHDDAYRQIQDEAAQFDRAEPTDRWQDFERPTRAAVDVSPEPPVVPPQAPSAWTLSDEAFQAVPATPAAGHDINLLESRISGLSLVDEDAEPADASSSTPVPAVPAFEVRDSDLALVEEGAPGSVASEGAIVLVGGIGGPDPLRQILQQLKPGLRVPVLVQQWLDGGQYDRLVRQMDRATELPVELATPGQPLQPAHVYIVPVAVGVERDAGGALQFADVPSRGFADVLSALPADSSGVCLLSGAGEEFVEPVLRLQHSGGRIYAQAAEGCYDHAVPALMISRGAEAHLPAGLATQLAARWQRQDSE